MSNTYQISDICSLVKGESPIMKTEPGEYPLVVTAEYRRSAGTYQLQGPAVCVPLISSTGHGDAALHRVHYQEGKFALANLLVALIPKDPSICDAKYLYHLLMAKKNEYFVPLMLGTANVSLKVQDIAGVRIQLPLLPEQRLIVAHIEELATKVHEAQTLRKRAVEEAEVLRDGNRNVFDDLAQRCEAVTLDSFATVKGGKRLPRGEQLVNYDTGHPYIRAGNLKDGTVTGEILFLPPEVQEAVAQYIVAAGDIYITIVGACIGDVGIVPDDFDKANLTENAARITLHNKSSVETEFLAHVLRSGQVQEQLASKRTIAAQPKLALHRIRSMKIPLPPIDEQRRIVAYLDSLQAKVDSLKKLQEETAKELNALMPSILSKAFASEI